MPGVILGHEFSGRIRELGAGTTGLELGSLVTVMPVISCKACEQCRAGRHNLCTSTRMLGVDLDGCFAELVVVPAESVFSVPEGTCPRVAAYSEPIAAALAVTRAGIQAGERGIIYGANRIATLTQRVLAATGYGDVPIHSECAPPLDPCSYDFVIETIATTQSFSEIVEALRPRGRLVLKSRQHLPAGIDMIRTVRKELTLQAVNYGSFVQAVELATSGLLRLDDLLGDAFPLDEFERAFEESTASEFRKIFFTFG